jgi:hypothetical protein
MPSASPSGLPLRAEMASKVVGGLPERRIGARNLTQRIEQREVMDRAVVAHARHVHTRLVQLAARRPLPRREARGSRRSGSASEGVRAAARPSPGAGRDPLCVHLDARHVHGRLVLKRRDDVARLVTGQLPERGAVLVELLEQSAVPAVDRRILRGIDLRSLDCGAYEFPAVGIGAVAPVRDAAATQATRPSATREARPSGSVQLPTSAVASGSPLVLLRK